MSTVATSPTLTQLMTAVQAAAGPICAGIDSQLAQLKQVSATEAVEAAELKVGATYIQPADLQAAINGLGQDGVDLLMGDGLYHLITTIILHKNIRLIGRGQGKTNLTINPNPGASSGFLITNSGFEAGSFTLVGGAAKAFVVTAPGLYLHDIESVDGPSGQHLEMFLDLEQNSDNALVVNVDLGITNAQGIYCTSDNLQVVNYSQKGSVGEHCIRVDVNANGHRPANLSFSGLHLVNHNASGKEAFTARECNGLTISWAEIDGYIRNGEGYEDGKVYCSGFVGRNIKFLSQRFDGTDYGPLMDLTNNVDALLENVSGPGNPKCPMICVGNGGLAILRNVNYSENPPPGTSYRPLAIATGTGRIVQE